MIFSYKLSSIELRLQFNYKLLIDFSSVKCKIAMELSFQCSLKSFKGSIPCQTPWRSCTAVAISQRLINVSDICQVEFHNFRCRPASSLPPAWLPPSAPPTPPSPPQFPAPSQPADRQVTHQTGDVSMAPAVTVARPSFTPSSHPPPFHLHTNSIGLPTLVSIIN